MNNRINESAFEINEKLSYCVFKMLFISEIAYFLGFCWNRENCNVTEK